MSDTLLNNRLSDIVEAMNIISSPEWDDESNKFHHLLSKISSRAGSGKKQCLQALKNIWLDDDDDLGKLGNNERVLAESA